MTIPVACDICSQRYDVKQALLGKSLHCKACGADFLVCEENAPRPKDEEEEAPGGSIQAIWSACRGIVSLLAILASLAGMVVLLFVDPRVPWTISSGSSTVRFPAARSRAPTYSSRAAVVPTAPFTPPVRSTPPAQRNAAPPPGVGAAAPPTPTAEQILQRSRQQHQDLLQQMRQDSENRLKEIQARHEQLLEQLRSGGPGVPAGPPQGPGGVPFSRPPGPPGIPRRPPVASPPP